LTATPGVPGVVPGAANVPAPLAGFAGAASVLAGGGGTAGGGRLPGAGNCAPLESASCGLLVVFLRAGLPPASFRAPAKSRLLAWDAWEPAEAGALSCMATLLRCD
jgi:hypothetical protein